MDQENIAEIYLPVLKKAQSMKIPVVIDTQCLEGATIMDTYQGGEKALKMGVIEAYDMSVEAIVTKLMWALKRAKNYGQVKTIMHTNYVGEINKERKIY